MTLTLLPQNIKVDVGFYDDTEKKKLLTYPSAKEIEKIVANGILIPTAEFLTYYLYNRKKSGNPNYKDYETISQKIRVALSDLDGFVEFNEHSICTHEMIKEQRKDISEHIGEAIGLATVSYLHGLTDADWDPIPEQRGHNAQKTFDYQIASDGNQYVQVECKGSSVDDNRRLSNRIYSHKRNIKYKKKAIQGNCHKSEDSSPENLLYGMITAVDPRRSGNVKCWLVDPQPEDLQYNPQVFRLIARMRFLYNWISFISPRSQLASSIATRIAALEKLNDPFELDRVPLYRANGKPFENFPYNLTGDNFAFFTNKSHIVGESTGGVVLQLSDDMLFFIGVRENLISLASLQDFNKIMGFKFDMKSLKKDVECVISKGRFKRFHLTPSISYETSESNNYVRFQLHGQIHYSSSGLAFGLLPMEYD